MSEVYNPMMNSGGAAPMAAAPAAAAPLVAANPAPMTPPTPVMESGGTTSGGGGIRGWFGDINILDVTISAFIVATGFYAITWFKFNMMLQKTGYADLNTRVQRLESSAAKKAAAEANAAGSIKRTNRRPMMRI